MSDRKWTQEQLIEMAAGSEWPNPTPTHLAAYYFDIDYSSKKIFLTVYFDAPISDDEEENIWSIEGRIADHFSDEWRVGTKIQVITADQTPNTPHSGTIYRRGDKETPWDRWRARHGKPK